MLKKLYLVVIKMTEKKTKYQNDEIYNKFIAPLKAWIVENENTDDEVILDKIDLANYQMKRGETLRNREKIVKSLKLEFADQDFEGWKNVRLDKDVLKANTKNAKDNQMNHQIFFENSTLKPTFVEDGVRYEHTLETYLKSKLESDERDGRRNFKETGNLSGTYGVNSNEA
jgi:hypothetical protein